MFWWRSVALHRPHPHADGGQGERGQSQQARRLSQGVEVSFCRADDWPRYDFIFNREQSSISTFFRISDDSPDRVRGPQNIWGTSWS